VYEDKVSNERDSKSFNSIGEDIILIDQTEHDVIEEESKLPD